MVSFKQSDLDELSQRKYLSDVFIEFYFSYLSSIHQSDSILFVPPTISYLLASFEDEDDIEDCVKPLEFPNKDLIFFPVNDGGIHWSLLVFCRELNVFAHHDSFNGMNDREARELYFAVRDCVHETGSSRYRVEFRNKRRFMDGPSHVPGFARPQTPRQNNGYDCGLYVMAMAKAVCEWFCGDGEGNWLPEIERLDGDNVGDTMRPLVLQLIRDASEGRLGSVSCTIEQERCDDKIEIEELTSEEIELYQFWADFDDPVPATFENDLPLSPSLVKEKTSNVKKVEAFNGSDSEMVDRSPSGDSTSGSSSIVEERKPVKDVEKVEMENTTSDCRTSGAEREYLTHWPPEEKPTVRVKRGPPHSLLW